MMKKLRHAFALTDPKYLPMMGLPLLVPYIALGPVDIWISLGGALAVIVLNMAAVLVNTWSDRAGDVISFPRGYAATDQHIGYRYLGIWIAALYALLLFATVLMVLIGLPQVAVIYTAGWIVATIYSVGPRLKSNVVFSRLCIACGPSFAFAGGWALHKSLAELPPVIVLLFLAQGINTLLKDVPDADGDRRMGVRTLFTGVKRETLARLLPALWTLPYALATVGAFAGWWPRHYLWLWVLYPFALAVVRSPFVARDQDEREMVREFAQIYATAWVLANLVLFSSTPAVVILCGAAAVFYVAVLAAGIDRRGQAHRLTDTLSFGTGALRSAFGLGTTRTWSTGRARD